MIEVVARPATCPGTGVYAPPTLSEMARCPECGERIQVITSKSPGRPPARTLRWHLVAEQRVR